MSEGKVASIDSLQKVQESLKSLILTIKKKLKKRSTRKGPII